MLHKARPSRPFPRFGSLGLAMLLVSLPGRSSAETKVSAAPAVTPPRVEYREDAQYPEQANARAGVVQVVLFVTVEATGQVSAASVAESGGAAFDQAALDAIRRWTFSPAVRDGTPVSARIRVAFRFEPPPKSEPAEPAPRGTGSLSQAGAAPPAPKQPAAQPKVPATGTASAEDVVVVGRSHLPSRGASDYEIPVGRLAAVPRRDSASLLRLAPGVLLTNEGGEGHPYQIFLRGFDAREGQDIEITVDGVPVNEVGNPHGNGLADTHFVIPELVRNLRVVEGPFAPQQGNFAVAGSALYDLGLDEPGLEVSAKFGSFNTKRLLALYHPEGSSDHTFAGAELFSTDGFGENRQAERATAMGGYEIPLGTTGLVRLLATSYAAHYGQAGVLRQDDVEAGRKGFYDSYDMSQGGDSVRHSLALTLEGRTGATRLSQSAFFVLRDFRLRQNLTGFQQDPQETWQSLHPQRGDLIDQQSSTTTLGGRGSARRGGTLLGQRQELELGYFARYDNVSGVQRRDRAGTTIPYRTDLNLESGLTNIGVYADASLKPLSWVTLRGGLRGEFYHYLVTNLCAVTTQTSFGGDPLDTECFSSDRQGYRSPEQTASTSASVLEPRATLLLGAVRGFMFSVSYGLGSRSLDPQYVNQDLATPFAKVRALEAGVAYHRTFDDLDLSARSVFFQTRVDKDLFFNETEGRNTLANGTTRTGWAGNARVTGAFADLAASLTLVRATFDDTGLAIPYAPGLVLRGDGALFGSLPLELDGTRPFGTLGAGVSYVGPRPLPYAELSDDMLLVDLGASLRFRAFELGVTCTNLLDAEYRLAEYNYASDFHSQDYPTLVASRHFVAGEPRAIYGTLSVILGGEEASP
jgi:TonB family protein